MQRKNLFDGGYKAQFAIITYQWLKSRKWITYADIMADMLGCSAEELPANLSNCEGYGELKKAVGIVKKAICEKVGNDCFEEEGNNRNKRFRYIGKDDEKFNLLRKNVKKYWNYKIIVYKLVS